jgi:pyruvate-formate lyase
MQQVTIGGLLPTDDDRGQDACNDVTRLCLEAARRLPLNSPTLDLRVHAGTPDGVIFLASEALMSGGAHPVILNDDIIVPALANNSGEPIPLRDARNFACDGCYETMVAGQSEFSFGFPLSALDLIEKTLNRGAGLNGAGPVFLRGSKDSWRSKFAADIADFEEFCNILREHMMLACHRYLHNLTAFYGNKAQFCPSPLLSALIAGCLESKRDLTNGGARYHIFSPLLVGVSNAADSLHVIENLVFKNRVFTLTELTSCLATDWGTHWIEREGAKVPAFGPYIPPDRVKKIRDRCMEEPKFGNGIEAVDRQAWWLLETFVSCVQETYAHPRHKAELKELNRRFGTKERPFVISLAPGVGTFEQYVFSGSSNGASPDGRRAGASIASDMSPAPVWSDMPATFEGDGKLLHVRQYKMFDSLKSYNNKVMRELGDGAPVDYNIREDHPVDDLARLIRAFADGKGGSICTFTVANPDTFAAAQKDPERYNLVRVRMGGWTEFFVTLFPDHQEQHKRRPLYV